MALAKAPQIVSTVMAFVAAAALTRTAAVWVT